MSIDPDMGEARAHDPDAAPTLYAGPVKRSMTIAGHTTSISLEPLFWHALEEAARGVGLPLSAVVARIDAARLEADAPPNLASAIRCWLLANRAEKALSNSPFGSSGHRA